MTPGTVVAFTDVMCGWSTIAFHRFYAARAAAGLDDEVTLDPQLFLLEDVNQMASVYDDILVRAAASLQRS